MKRFFLRQEVLGVSVRDISKWVKVKFSHHILHIVPGELPATVLEI